MKSGELDFQTCRTSPASVFRIRELDSVGQVGVVAGVAEGIFPAPVKLGRTSAWSVRSIRRLLSEGTPQAAMTKRRRAS
jgi:hypothetical protein